MNAPPRSTPPLSRLARKLDTRDAVVIGLGSMIGAGVFSAIGPATRAAGNAVVLGLLIAGGLAYCNATSSAALAALYPESGGAYVYGRKRLGALWGFLAGWGFVVGKLASCAAMAVFGLRRAFGVLAAATILIAPSAARAVDPFEIQVYDGTVGGPGSVGIELHANTVVSGQRTAVPPELPSHHQSHFTLEPAFGITDWWEAGAYFQTALLPDGSFAYAGIKLRSKLAAPPRAGSPFHWAVNFEVSRVPERWDADRWGAELRPIATWSGARGVLYASVNPIVDFGLAGQGRNEAPSFEPAVAIRLVRAELGAIGLEYYANFGPIGRWLPAGAQEHYLFEVIDVLRWKWLELNAGVGEGFTDGSNHFIAKMIVGVHR